MSRLGYFLLSEDIENFEYDNGKNSLAIIGPILGLKIPYIPSTYTLYFSAGVVDVDTNDEQSIKIEVNNKVRNEKAFEFFKDLKVPSDIKNTESKDNTMFFQISGALKNILFKDEGIYEIQFYLNNVLLGTTEIKVELNNNI